MAVAVADDGSRVGYLFHTIKREDLRPGDHIYVYTAKSQTEHAAAIMK